MESHRNMPTGYSTKQFRKTTNYSSMVCEDCKGEIVQSGGDSMGFVYFLCPCKEWKSKTGTLGTMGYYNEEGIEPVKKY